MIEFYVGNYRIDMARSQMVAQDSILSMEPKVLQVLLILAENQGQVVPHDVILNKVWPDSVISANAIQRCIAQLRKAFNDDAKTQKVISTHPKVGYSLLVDVKWQTETDKVRTPETHIEQESEDNSDNNVFRFHYWQISIAVAFIAFVVFIFYGNTSTDKLNFTQLTPLTATDNKELQPSYSPDGRYIAFERYKGVCENQLWAKDTVNNKEYLLTEEIGIYGTPSWSPDGSQIIFSSASHCQNQQIRKDCKELRVISFALAKSSPQASRKILSCDNRNYHSPVWLDNENIAFISGENDQDTLLNMSLTENKVNTIYAPQNDSLYSLDYSSKFNLLAVSQFDAVDNFSLVLIDPLTLETTVTALQPEDKQKGFWQLNWHPNQKTLITSAEQSLYTVDLNGQFTEYVFPAMQNIYSPSYHPNGQSVVAAMGVFDSDIGQLSWSQLESSRNLNRLASKPNILARSTANEHGAKYQPNGEHIAFISNRTGSKQIWLLNSNETEGTPNQLSYFTEDKEVNAFVWSPDGRFIIVNTQGELAILSLDGEVIPMNVPFDVVDIYHNKGENQMLVKVIENNQYVIKLINFDNSHAETLYIGSSQKALLTAQGDLFVIDEEFVLKQLVDNQLLPVEAFSENKAFSIFQGENNSVLIADSTGKLWQYNLDSFTKLVLFNPEEKLGTITDVILGNKQLLFSKTVSIKKGIVLFH